jgi:hypothetical protein
VVIAATSAYIQQNLEIFGGFSCSQRLLLHTDYCFLIFREFNGEFGENLQ